MENEEIPSVSGRLRRPRAGRKWTALAVLALLLAAALGWGGWYYLGKRKLAPSGGIYAWGRTELPVPLFLQGDPAWGRDQLALSVHTLSQTGCAVCAVAMVMRSYGVDTDPGRLNNFLRDNGGFNEDNDLLWEGPPKMAPQTFRHVYEDLPSYYLIDSNLRRGNPVIVRLLLPSGWTHFVVIMGKEGFDYLIRDPSSKGRTKGVYPLKDYGRPIEALRYYEKI